jgi:hypothetical protein
VKILMRIPADISTGYICYDGMARPQVADE